MTESAEWRVAQGSVLSWRELDGDWLVYDAGSGAVHCMGLVAAVLLDQIGGGVSSEQALRAWLIEAATGAVPADALRDMDGALADLRRSGLIEAVPR